VTRGLADTSVFIAMESGRPLNATALPDDIAVSMITIGELRAGVLAASNVDVRERRLETLIRALSFDPTPVDDDVASHWARLRVMLRDAGLRLPANDSWIAATAMALDIPLLTQDADYPALPGLSVTRV
jgi:predicted nucleic acid-binding protein